MLHFLASNAGTIVLSAVLAVIVGSIVVHLLRQKKRGQSTCGGGCAECSGTCHCKL